MGRESERSVRNAARRTPAEPEGPARDPAGEEALSAYVHVPFCRRLCPYCDFLVVVERPGQRKRYLDRLLEEIGAEPAAGGPLRTVYFGGGTPSRLRVTELRAILDALAGRFGLEPGAEVTVEANPDELEPEQVEGLLRAGVTRLSLGVQSFDDEALRFLGRSHCGAKARDAVELVRDAGFRSFSVDLIFGVPRLDLRRSLASVEQALDLDVPHLSHYGLTYHEETAFGRALAAGRIRRMGEDLEADLYEAAAERCLRAGLEHYEISNFARPGHRCRHNLACWRSEPFLAFGPGAVSFLHGRRYRNPGSFRHYLSGAVRSVEPEDRRVGALEVVLAGLRLLEEGVLRERFRELCGRELEEAFPRALRRGTGLGLLEADGARVRLRGLRGALLYDSVLELFFDEPAPREAPLSRRGERRL